MNLSTLLAGVMIVALQAQVAAPAGTAVGPASTTSPHVLFRWNDPAGQVNYGDRPPTNARNIVRIDLRTISEHTESRLPYLLRQAASNFPVILYTSADCVPCREARDFLSKRGVPFAERTVETADDATEFKRLTGATGVPVAVLGKRPLISFDPAEWNKALDAAGYPGTSQLPAGFRQEPARPLTQSASAETAAR